MFQMKNRWKNILVGCLTVFGILIPSLSCRAENVGSIQIEYHGRTQENEEVVFANADFSVFFVGKMEDGKWTLAGDFGNAGVSPVSYTHLDVYKRQGLHVVNIRSVTGGEYAGGFLGLADVSAILQVSNGNTSILSALLTLGGTSVLDTFRSYVYHSDVSGSAEAGLELSLIHI